MTVQVLVCRLDCVSTCFHLFRLSLLAAQVLESVEVAIQYIRLNLDLKQHLLVYGRPGLLLAFAFLALILFLFGHLLQQLGLFLLGLLLPFFFLRFDPGLKLPLTADLL